MPLLRSCLSCILLTACSIPLFGGSGDTQGEIPDGNRSESEHIVIVWKTGNATDQQVARAGTLAELAFTGVSHYLGADRTPDKKIIVVLEGDARNGIVPFSDGSGRIHLFQFREDLGGYFGMLPHEMAHAFRHSYHKSAGVADWDGFDFVEEAFAELVADKVEPGRFSFPTLGVPSTVAAGQWFERNLAIPLVVLRERHDELNLKCSFQAYTLRGSFARFLDDRFGRGKVFELAYSRRETRPALYREIFQESFEQLAAEWRSSLQNDFEALPTRDELVSQYRKRTSGVPFCVSGRDFQHSPNH